MPDWVTTGFNEYAKRLQGGARLELHEIPASVRKGRYEPARARIEEGRRLLAATPGRAWKIALDVSGRPLGTEALAQRIRDWNRTGDEVALLVGGPDGLDPGVLAAADECWSLSALTLPHPLVRVIVAEQVYRALSILYNHPYHR